MSEHFLRVGSITIGAITIEWDAAENLEISQHGGMYPGDMLAVQRADVEDLLAALYLMQRDKERDVQ